MKRFVIDRRYWLLPVAVWTAVVAASLGWNWAELDRHVEELATHRARFVFKMVESVRLWNARHGGVYAPATEATPPNPYLELPERDISGHEGAPLTLLNPAYMTRQVAEVVGELTGMRMHLTSLKPLNPDNRADEWERRALTAFEEGRGERAEFIGENTAGSFRYMAPLVTQQACLKCHEKQGYRVGDIRGGVSVAFPAAPLFATVSDDRRRLSLSHAAVWLLLSALTLLALSRLRLQMLSLKRAKDEQDVLVAQRTAELREEVAEREAAESRLRLLLESSGEGIYGVDRDGRCTFCNPTALRLLGYERVEEVLGADMHGRLHAGLHTDQADADACPLAGAYRQGAPAHVEDARFRRRDGATLEVEYRAQPIHQHGERLGAVVSFDDISARKAAEQQLRKLSQALEHSPESVIITDAKARIEYVNARFQESTGYRAEEVIGHNPRMLQSGETPTETYRQMWEALRQGQVWQGEFRNRRKDGSRFWEKASIAPITDRDGHITHFVAVKDDISERKRLEARIWHQANYDDLTGLVNRHLFHDRLGHALEHARRNGENFALLYIDLDGFKAINDTFGHDAGDELLRQVGARISASVRQSDTVARMGGDEFTVIVSRVADAAAALGVADKVLAALDLPVALKGQSVSVAASVGVALYPQDGDDAEALLRSADRAMYAVKRSGRRLATEV